MNITLNATEQRLAKHLAKARHAMNRSSNTDNARLGPQSDELTDLEGIAAEIAFCKIHNIYPDLDTDARPPEDATLKDGSTVDVKATTYHTGKLVAVPWKKPAVDLFALMVGSFPTYRFAGYAKAKELLSNQNLTDLGHGPTFAMTQDKLTA